MSPARGRRASTNSLVASIPWEHRVAKQDGQPDGMSTPLGVGGNGAAAGNGAAPGIGSNTAPHLAYHDLRKWLEEARSYRFGETLSFRYRVVLRDDLAHQALLQQLSMLDGVERVMLYADEDGAGDAD